MPPVAQEKNSDLMVAVDALVDQEVNGIDSLNELARRLEKLWPPQTEKSWRRTLKRMRGPDSTRTERNIGFIAKAFDIPRADLPPSTQPPTIASLAVEVAELRELATRQQAEIEELKKAV